MRRRVAGVLAASTALLIVTSLGATAHADDTFYPTASPSPAAPADASATDSTTSGANRELSLARGDRQAADTVGWLPSLYQGRWYQPQAESIRRCIMDRESNFNYRVVGAGTYFGAYQMNRNLAYGATYTMQKEVAKEMGDEGVALVKALRTTAPNTWNRYWQDRAFWTIWRNGAGAGNWRGGGLNCF